MKSSFFLLPLLLAGLLAPAAAQEHGPHETAPATPGEATADSSGGDAEAATVVPVENPTAFLDKVMGTLVSDGVEAAFEVARTPWPFEMSEFRNLSRVSVRQFPEVEERFGAVLGHEHLGTRTVGESLRREYYLLKMEKAGLRFVFDFYRPEPTDGWFLIGLTWDEGITALFDQLQE